MRVISAMVLGVLLCLSLVLSSGCSDRVETPTLTADSTWVYAGKTTGDVSARITFTTKSKPSKKTGKRRGVGTAFDIKEKRKVYAFVDIQNQFARGEDPLSFHVVWLKPDDKEFYTKRFEYEPSDSDTTLKSSRSISPKWRGPGTYKVRVYLFRELIAEKSFRLRGDVKKPEEEETFEGVTG